MKKILYSMSNIQEVARKVFLYHVSSITITLFILMGAAAGCIIFFFAYSTPMPDISSAPVMLENVSVATSVVDSISRYASDKQHDSTGVPVLPTKVFFIPPAK